MRLYTRRRVIFKMNQIETSIWLAKKDKLLPISGDDLFIFQHKVLERPIKTRNQFYAEIRRSYQNKQLSRIKSYNNNLKRKVYYYDVADKFKLA
jgi:hypothetical protein